MEMDLKQGLIHVWVAELSKIFQGFGSINEVKGRSIKADFGR